MTMQELRSSILRLQAEEAQLDATINTTQQQSRNILGSLEQPLMSETSRKSTPHDISQRGLISKPTEGKRNSKTVASSFTRCDMTASSPITTAEVAVPDSAFL